MGDAAARAEVPLDSAGVDDAAHICTAGTRKRATWALMSAEWLATTGFRVNFIAYRLCPVIFTDWSLLITAGSSF
jgi:hypothetical protein